ncbi:TonB-dependent receptor [Novosphingobium album (ex Hu et al. 2023)]|uniref:TonB-dependent receptor n=1 Tax=Novosphingobium album (ex Hu et al. 2023) TaxID=2930093 RepID=A0ABT0AWT3_9SPHN|nr:TonB-dependent receptor [Novosphingobium album (ex Hu et al. 2023)]MCJ2177242.1 TonB-dependent receptor [Novosphingobium album (ex Hu et al. 2023)]
MVFRDFVEDFVRPEGGCTSGSNGRHRRALFQQAFSILALGTALAGVSGARPAKARDAEALLADTADAASPTDSGGSPILVTVRRRTEDSQKVPVAMSVVSADTITRTYTVNTRSLTELVPTLAYSSPNPRNTTFKIRGLGAGVAAISAGNDGLEPGVGFYVDQVYHARPATASFDFSDVEQIEALRGPQGTLFGKNTTAGAINITTRKPQFDWGADGELSLGSYDMVRASAAVTGPLVDDTLAFRLSGLINRRDGLVTNVRYGKKQNDIDNKAFRAQLLFKPASNFSFRLIGDWSNVKGDCCVPVYWKVVPTLRSASRQYAALAAGQNYEVPSTNVYDRETDIDSALNVDTSEGGLSGTAELDLGAVTLTSVSAWRFWKWDVNNDRDYTGLSIQTIQRIPSRHDQYSQELRLASNGHGKLEYVAGLYFLDQTITANQNTVYGPLAAYWLLGSTYPDNLLDGYGLTNHTKFTAKSYAIFGEVTWRPLPRLAVTGGIRYTYEDKDGSYNATTSGGLETTDAALIAAKNSILRAQSYTGHVGDGSASGRVNLAYDLTDGIMVYAGYAQGQKSGGINMAGLPVDTAGNPVLSKAVVGPETHSSWEAGIKARAFGGALTVNVDAYHTDVTDFQANTVDTVAPAALRTYLSNIPKVRVQGVELDGALRIGMRFSLRFAGAYTDAKYVSYPKAPCPIEMVGGSSTVCDLSGKPLPGTSKWSGSVGGEYALPVPVGPVSGDLYLRADVSAKSRQYGDGSDSAYLIMPGYALVNASIGYRTGAWEVALFARNLFDRNYLENVTAQTGNSGLILANPGEPRVVGVTLRLHH